MMVADTVNTATLAPVHGRISWGAILAGSVLALSLYFLLSLLGSAIGLSISDKVSGPALGNGAAIYSIAVIAGCLFLGGYVASHLTTGEDKLEGTLYGILVWATMSAMLMCTLVTGVKMGFSAVVGVATAGNVAVDKPVDWEASARQAGVPQDRIDDWKAKAKDAPTAARQAVEDPQNQKAAADAATRVAWYAFFGIWISMMSGAAGGYVGAHRTFWIFAGPAGMVTLDGRPLAARI